jgi:parallel beta-helix repeat protein
MPNFIKGLPAEGSALKSSEIRNNFLALDARTGKITCRATVPSSTSITTDPGTIYFMDRVAIKMIGQKIDLGDPDTGVLQFNNIGYFKDIAIVARVSFNSTTQNYEATTLFLEGPEKTSSTSDASIIPIRANDIPIARFVVRHNGISLISKGQIEPISQAQISDFRNYLDVGGITYYSATVGDRQVMTDAYGVPSTSGETIGTYVANVRDVDGYVANPLIQAIEDLPSTGGTVFIRRGTYTISETIEIPANVSLLGEGSSVVFEVEATFSGPAIRIVGDKVSISNITISGAGVGTLINLVGASNCTIKDCYILNGVTGLELDLNSFRNIITNNYISENSGAGVSLVNDTKNILSLNQFENNAVNYTPASPMGHQLIGNMET